MVRAVFGELITNSKGYSHAYIR